MHIMLKSGDNCSSSFLSRGENVFLHLMTQWPNYFWNRSTWPIDKLHPSLVHVMLKFGHNLSSGFLSRGKTVFYTWWPHDLLNMRIGTKNEMTTLWWPIMHMTISDILWLFRIFELGWAQICANIWALGFQ